MIIDFSMAIEDDMTFSQFVAHMHDHGLAVSAVLTPIKDHKHATIKAIMSVLNAWQDSKLDQRCAEEILAAVERMT